MEPEADRRLAESRRKLEQRLAETREAIDREIGVVPRTLGWVVPLLAFSVGLVVARKVSRRRHRELGAD